MSKNNQKPIGVHCISNVYGIELFEIDHHNERVLIRFVVVGGTKKRRKHWSKSVYDDLINDNIEFVRI